MGDEGIASDGNEQSVAVFEIGGSPIRVFETAEAAYDWVENRDWTELQRETASVRTGVSYHTGNDRQGGDP
jgi:hypothetical protein